MRTTDSVRSAVPKINRILGPAPAAVASPAPGANKIKLPKLSIAPFEGSYVKWLTFWDSYESAVHNNPELSDVNKFTYLQPLLQKEAKDSIAGLALTSANYQAAIEILKKRFGDSAQITAKHMEELMGIDAVTSNHNLPALRHLYDTIEVHVRGLLGHWVCLQNHMVLS